MKSPINSTSPATRKQVGVWIRVSTEDQAQGDSPEYHELRAREYAKFNGWDVVEVYDLAGVSGKTVMDHPEARRMLADVKRGRITGLIFSKLARLARNTKELLDFSDYFRAAGADMISIQEKIDTSTPSGRFFYTMIGAMGAWEREETVERVKASIATRAKLGRPLSGASPYGFRWVDKKLTIQHDEAAIVLQIYTLFAIHRRKGTVAKLLNAAGHRTRKSSKWSDMAVGRVLAQTASKGYYWYNVSRRTGAWKTEEKPESEWGRIELPAIVSGEAWDSAAQVLEEQSKARPGRLPAHVFASRAECHCGGRMYVPTASRKYSCRRCKHKILADDLDAIFYEQLKTYFLDADRLAEHFRAAHEGVAKKEAQLEAHKREIAKTREDMTRTHRLYLDGQIPLESFGTFHKPLEERLRGLLEALPKLEAEVAHLSIRDVSAEEVRREATDLHDRWPALQPDDKRKVVESIAEKIVVGEGEVEIRLAYLPSSPEVIATSQQSLTDQSS